MRKLIPITALVVVLAGASVHYWLVSRSFVTARVSAVEDTDHGYFTIVNHQGASYSDGVGYEHPKDEIGDMVSIKLYDGRVSIIRPWSYSFEIMVYSILIGLLLSRSLRGASKSNDVISHN
jgi:hypothetical protein